MENILIIDDHHSTRHALAKILEANNYSHVSSPSAELGFAEFKEQKFDLVITDLKLPGMSGLDLLKKIRDLDDQIPIILITAYASIDTAVEAMRLGAFDYVTKPFTVEEIEIKIEKALASLKLTRENQLLQLENQYLREETGSKFSEIIGNSDSMKKVFKLVEKVAQASSPVLITGESGTGKELIARAIHMNSPRIKEPFVKVSCSALAEGVLESELFGHEKGAFTGAHRQKPGRFEIAGAGTLFLDEIGDIPLSTQVKLLRVLQEREFERVGGNQTIKMNARILAATNQTLLDSIQNKTFREDLYYRINVVEISLPPLRSRLEDIPLLVNHFIQKYNRETGKRINAIDDDAMDSLLEYNWRGNIRELENVVERAVVLASGQTITQSLLPANISTLNSEESKPSRTPEDFNDRVGFFEKEWITSALKKHSWNISKAAAALQLKRTTLRYKMSKYDLLRDGNEKD